MGFQFKKIKAKLDLAHFKPYADDILLFEIVYFIPNSDYNKYMDIQQHTNLAPMHRLRVHDIASSYLFLAYGMRGDDFATTSLSEAGDESYPDVPAQ